MMNKSHILISLFSLCISLSVCAMQPSYSDVRKRLNQVNAVRSDDGALVSVEFIPRGGLYRGDTSRVSIYPDGRRKGNITLLSQEEAQQLYEHLMNSE